MGRRDDERPAIDIIGAEPEITSVQHVSTRGPGRQRRGRVRGLVGGAAVAGLLLAGLALGGNDDRSPPAGEETATTEERTTTSRRSTTTRPPTTTTTIAVGPLFAGHDLQGWLLSGNASGWTLVDLESGALLDPKLPFDDPYSTRSVTGGVVTIRAGQLEYHDLRVPNGVREPVELGLAEMVVAGAEPDQVWLIAGVYDGDSADDGRARLVDVTGRELRSFPVPTGDYTAATTEGLLFERGGRVYVVNESGVDPIAVGQLVGAVGSLTLVYACDDDASCGIDLRRPSGERVRRLAIDSTPAETGVDVSRDGRGRFALLTYGAVDSSIALFEPDGTLYATVDEAGGYLAGPLAWLPGDAGLVGVRDNRVVWIHSTSEGWMIDEVGAVDDIESQGALVIATQ